MNCLVEAWDRHEAELRGFLVRGTGDPSVTDDLLQELFMRALAQGSRFCQLDDPRAWLYRVARNLLTDHHRRQKPQAPLTDEPGAEPVETAPIAGLAACLPRALAELPAADGEALTLCDLEGMSQADYARRVGLSLPAAKSRVQRARRRLREHLRDVCQVRFDETGSVCCFVPRQRPR